MSFFQDFREFATRGNIVDMAVGVVIGVAFGKVVSSAVDDLLMPPLGLAIGGMHFKDLAFQLKAATDTAPAVLFRYGAFLQNLFDFLILAFALFLFLRLLTRLHLHKAPEPAAPAPPPEPSEEVKLLTEIRDSLRTRG